MKTQSVVNIKVKKYFKNDNDPMKGKKNVKVKLIKSSIFNSSINSTENTHKSVYKTD